MTRFLEWLGRVVMLVLAGMITLSIMGAIASIPSGSIETRLGVEPRDWPQAPSGPQGPPLPPPVPEERPASEPSPETAPAPEAAPGSPQMIAVAGQADPVDAADWLEAITYALLSLAGLAALGILLLFRALRHWRRSADALEALAASRSLLD